MKKLLNRKEALGMIDAIFTSLHFNLISIKDLGIENSKERDYFLAEAWKIDQGRLKKDYEQTVNSLDAIGFKEYYKLIGKFATKYKIGCWKEYNEYEPILVEELNEELRKYDKTEDKLELINSFTVDELQSESFIFDSKVQVLYDILDDFNVGNNKEEGINTVLESFNSSDKASFIAKLQTDKNLLNALIDKVNGTQKDEMFSLLGEMFISSGFITSQKQTLLGNEANDPISASFYKGHVNIILHSSLPSCSGIKKCITVSPFEIIGMNYDGREIQVPAFLLLNSWSNTFAEPEGIFFNYKHEDIDWNSLDEKQKDEYFYDFVVHYLPSGFIEALGSPIQIIIMSCIAILTGGLLAELQVALAAAGIVMSIADAKNAVGGIVQANKQKEASTTMHEAKKAAKVMAESIAKLTLDVINVICTVAGYFKGKKIVKKETEKISNTISRNDPIVKQIEKETSSAILNELAAKNNIKKQMSSKIKEVGWTEEIFAEKVVKPISSLNDEELLKIKQINEVIPNPTNDTLMSKVITEKTYLNYISNGEYSDTIGNCLTKAEDLFDCKTYMDYYNKLGLNYFVDGIPSPYSTAEKMYIVRFTSGETESKVVRNLGGTNDIEVSRIKNLYKDCSDISVFKQDDPFVGNGFTKTPSGELGKPEYNTIGYCQIKNNAAIYELSRDGKEILVAIRIRNKWRKLED